MKTVLRLSMAAPPLLLPTPAHAEGVDLACPILKKAVRHDNLNSSPRKTMIQPYPYWVLKTPLAYFVCLYANDINGGQLDDPESDATPQFNWLVDTLKAIRKADDGCAVFLMRSVIP